MAPSARVSRPTIHVAVDGLPTPLGRVRSQRVVEAVLRAEKVRSALVSIAFVTDTAIAALNRKHLKHAGPTDVISFGFDRPTKTDPVVGDIYIAPAVAARHARATKGRMRDELTRLLVHGTLHVLGYEHPENEDREHSAMWRRQEQLVRRLSASGTR